MPDEVMEAMMLLDLTRQEPALQILRTEYQEPPPQNGGRTAWRHRPIMQSSVKSSARITSVRSRGWGVPASRTFASQSPMLHAVVIDAKWGVAPATRVIGPPGPGAAAEYDRGSSSPRPVRQGRWP